MKRRSKLLVGSAAGITAGALVVGAWVVMDPAQAAAPAPAAAPVVAPQPVAAPAVATAAAAPVVQQAAAAPTAVVAASKCAYKPTLPKPAKSGKGKRIIYSEKSMHVWVVIANGCVIRDYKVSGRKDWPKVGKYRVFSKSRSSTSTYSGAKFNYMIRFAHGHSTSIGFHDIPTKNGKPVQSLAKLGHAIPNAGGCVRQKRADAKWLYKWAKVGTRVVVIR